MKPTEAAWLAGIIDGEGSLLITQQTKRIYNPSFEAQVSVVNTALIMVQRCKELGNGTVIGPIGRGKPGTWKPAYRWCVKRQKAAVVLNAIIPYLVTKREQALILLHLIQQTNSGACKGQWGRKSASPEEVAERHSYKLAVQALNHRGDSPIPSERLAALARVREELGCEQGAVVLQDAISH